jgi:hypothetical protein
MWLHIPSTFLASAPDTAALTSESDWRFRMLERSATWRGKYISPRNWRRALKRATWMMPLFGRMSEPSTAERGAESFIASLRAAPASHSVPPASCSARQTLATFGLTLPASSAKSSRLSSSSKMLQTTFGWDSGKLETSYEEWATALRRDFSRRLKSALRSHGRGFSPWPTPTADPNRNAHVKYKQGGTSLSLAAELWATVTATDAHGHQYTYDRGDKTLPRLTLAGQAQLWASPSSRDWKGSCTTLERPNGAMRLDQLDRQAEYFLPPETTSTAGAESSKKRPRLNPLFTEWLMGVPLGWTSLVRLETESYRSWLHMHSALLRQLLTAEGGRP